jgi:YVTN family beta-propeller protein
MTLTGSSVHHTIFQKPPASSRMTSNVELTYHAIVAQVWSLSLAAAMTLFPSGAIAQTTGSSPPQLERKIPLGKVTGRIDHMAIDLARRRLFVAELGNDSVGVVDLKAQKVVHRISGLKEPQGVAYIRMNDSLYVANGGDGSVRVFHGPDYSPAGRIDLGADADNIRADLAANRILVGFGSGAIAVVDLRDNAKTKTFALKAHPESFQLDAESGQLFVNLPNTRTIAVLDANTGKEEHTWPLRHGGNFPMALDPERKRVLVAFRNPAKLAAFDWQTSGLLSEVDICGDADDLFLDQKLNRIYVTCGAGFIDVLRADDAKYSRVARVPTAPGARTGLFVPEINRLLLGVRSRFTEPAAIWVYRTAP